MNNPTYQNTKQIQKVYSTGLMLNINNIKKFIINEFVHGGHLVSLASSTIALSAMILLNITIRWEFLIIAYLGTYCIYGYDRYKGINIDSSDNFTRTNHLRKYYGLIPFVLIAYGIAFISLIAYFGNITSLLFGGFLLFSSLFYTKKVKKMTTKIIGFKNVYTSFSVSLLIIFTAIYCSYPIGWLLLIIFAFLFLRLIIDTSFCDIKDMDTDKKLKLLTLPLYFGKQKFLSILHIINLVSFGLLLLAVIMQIVAVYWLLLGVFTIYCFFYIQKAKNPETNFQSLSSIVVDGEYLLWPIILFAGKLIMPAL